MNTQKQLETESQTLSFRQDGITIGQIVFREISHITLAANDLLQISGISDHNNSLILSGIEPKRFLENLTTERKRSPNQALLSHCLGLTQFALAEEFMGIENGKALIRFRKVSMHWKEVLSKPLPLKLQAFI